MNEIPDFNICWKFRPRWICFGGIIRKTGNQFPSPVFLIKFILSLWNQQFFAASSKCFDQKRWNFCEKVLIDILAETEIWTQQCQGKGKWMETMWLRYQPLITCDSRMALKSTFYSTEARSSVSSCQIYFPIVLGTTYTNFKIFSHWTRVQCS